MHQHIQKDTLLVVSDTSAFYRDGVYYAFEPMVREMAALSERYDITWLTCKLLHTNLAVSPVTDGKIKIVVMPSVRRKHLNWLFVIFNYPVFAYYILKHWASSKYIHTRGPSHPALIAVLVSKLSKGKMCWHKYAGNWKSDNAPFSYRLQKWLLSTLSAANNRITVNGHWEDTPGYMIAFENPCLYELERSIALNTKKMLDSGYKLLFVGNLDENKGVIEFIEAIAMDSFPAVIDEVIIIGDGQLKDEVVIRLKSINKINIRLMGLLNRSELNLYYQACHFLVLPSRSEGFPKVLAEAAAYGCVPIATNVSAIGQYIQDAVNGYLLPNNAATTIVNVLNVAVKANYMQLSDNARSMAAKFTYEHYVKRVSEEVLR